MSNLLDGRYVVQVIGDKIDKEFNEKHQITGAFVQVGNNFASNTYVGKKVDLCIDKGITPLHHRFDEEVPEQVLLDHIYKLNNDNSVHGIMVQLPLPEHINTQRIIDAIKPEKDIDGFTTVNKGKIMIGDPSALIPCTPKGIMTILQTYGLDNLEGKIVTIVGRSEIVGKPLAQLMINAGATVTVCNSKTPPKKLTEQILKSDIFISAIGKANYFNQRLFIEHTRGHSYDTPYIGQICPVAIDVGINRGEDGKLCGDISRDLYNYFKFITPVPNGVGRTTVLEVIRNLIRCYEIQNYGK